MMEPSNDTGSALGEQLSLLGEIPILVPGLSYRPEWLEPAEGDELLATIDSFTWSNELSRRVQHHGWAYDYRDRSVSADSYRGPLPEALEQLAARICDALHCDMFDQVIVNEYLPGQGIAPHTDCVPCFGPVVASVSLGSAIQMDLAGPDGTRSLRLDANSLLALSGDARLRWTHGIAKRLRDPQYGLTRARRVSLTFRTVIPAT